MYNITTVLKPIHVCHISMYMFSQFVIISKGSKRRRPEEEDENESKEELWSLRDVIFLSPPFSSARVGRVMKLDGFYAAVLFPSLNKEEKGESKATPTSEDNGGQNKDTSVLSQCRLLRRDDLVVSTSAYSIT